MRSKLFRPTLLCVLSIVMITSGLMGLENSVSGRQGSQGKDQKYAGTWVGSFNADGGGKGNLSYTLSKDKKGQWRGTVIWTNEQGEQKADFKALQIVGGKMKGKIETPDGKTEVAIEGQLQGDQLEGIYSVLPKGDTKIAEKGSWKVKKSSAPKTGK